MGGAAANRTARRALIFIAAVLAALLVMQAASIQLLRQQNWPTLLLPFPDDSRAVLLRSGIAEATMLTPEELPATLMPAIRRAHSLDALDPLPFVAAGLVARGTDPATALPLFEASIRRDPRRTAARLHFIRAALEEGRFAAGVGILAQTVTLRPDQSDRLIPALILARYAPGGDRLVSEALHRDAGLRSKAAAFLSTLPDPDHLLPRIAAMGLDQPTRTLVISNLAAHGQYAEAYRLWRRGAPDAASQPFDPELRGRPAPSPFGWTLASDSNLNAYFGTDTGAPGHLSAELFGQVRTTVVSQALLLAPGRYRLLAAVEANGPPASSGAFEWSLACANHNSDDELTMIRFPAGQPGPATSQTYFEVPAGCPAQLLTLTGIPDDSGSASRMTFTRIAVRPA